MKIPFNKLIPWDFFPYPLNPPEYYYQPGLCACGESEEDCPGDCTANSMLSHPDWPDGPNEEDL